MPATGETIPATWRRAMRWVRPAVVTTGTLPGLRELFAGLYALHARRLAARLAPLGAHSTVLLRGSARRRPRPGLSDMDITVLLGDQTCVEELRAVERALSDVRAVNRFLPLCRDVAFLTRAELRAMAALDHPFLSVLRLDHEVLVHGAPSLTDWLADLAPPSPVFTRAALGFEVAYWTLRGVKQWLAGGDVDAQLAGRSLAKAAHYVQRQDASSLLKASRGQNRGAPRVAGAVSVAAALADLERVLDAQGDEDVAAIPLEHGVRVLDRPDAATLAKLRGRARLVVTPSIVRRRVLLPPGLLGPASVHAGGESSPQERRWMAGGAILQQASRVRSALGRQPLAAWWRDELPLLWSCLAAGRSSPPAPAPEPGARVMAMRSLVQAVETVAR